MAAVADLDARYPALSGIVPEAIGLTLEALAARSPARNYEFYDLERLCADGRDSLHLVDHPLFEGSAQIYGYLAILNEYVANGFVKRRPFFVQRKLLAPKRLNPSAPSPSGFNCLDTIMECSWGLMFADNYAKVEEECPIPGDQRKNVDFCIERGLGPLWVDCVSPYPEATQTRGSLEEWILEWTRNEWQGKFLAASTRPGGLSTGLAITMIKTRDPRAGSGGMLDALVKLDFMRTIGDHVGTPPEQLWTECPGLEVVWVGEPQFSSSAFRPRLVCEWRRPGC
jgi:hypothetical protein